MERQTITVDIAPGNSQVERLGSSQGDIGRQMGVYIIQNGVALDCSAYSAELYIIKPDGKFYTTQATVDATEKNLIKWETALQETPVAGACVAQIRIAAGDDDIGTACFVEFVEASPGDMGSASESEVALLTEYVRQARESATSAGRDATTASGAASSASGSASTATTAANTATQAATAATAAADRAEAVEESIPADYSQLSDDVSGLKSVFEQLNDNVITESAGPASIVSIADGADGMPMRNVKVAIEPVQDLHGYDAPWPAGGGVNRFDGVWESGGLNGTTGEVNTYTAFSRSVNFIAVLSNTAYYVYGSEITSTTEVFVFAYQDDGTYINYEKLESNGTYTTPSNCAKVRLQVRRTIETVTNYLYAINYPNTVTTYSSYSNICPISGWTGAKVTRTGKNLFDESKYLDVYSNYEYTSGSYRCKRIQLLPNTTYTISQNAGAASSSAIILMNVVEQVNASGFFDLRLASDVKTYTTDSTGCLYIGCYVSSDTAYIERFTACKVQIELGSTASEYESYHGQTYEVTFPADPGTVYGGTLDVVSGKLVVDRICRTVTECASVSTASTGVKVATVYLPSSEYTDVDNLLSISSAYKIRRNAPSDSGWFRTNNSVIYIYDDRFTDKTTANGILAVEQPQFCYVLATPTVITGLDQATIVTLLGRNNLFASTGAVSIEYPADTKMYIDNRINSTRRLIAGIETGFTASKAYAVGDMLIIGDDLYKVASSIASGATITVGTNVTKTTVAEQLIALANA